MPRWGWIVALWVVAVLVGGAAGTGLRLWLGTRTQLSAEAYWARYAPAATTRAHVLAHAQTGDVLLLSGGTYTERCCQVVVGSVFTHVALVVRDAEDVWIWESDVGQGQHRGARVMPLAHKLDVYRGSPVAAWKRVTACPVPLPTLQARVVASVHRHLPRPFDTAMLPWFLHVALGVQVRREGPTAPVFCSELVATTAADAGLLDGRRAPTTYSPADWHYDTLDLAPGVRYAPPLFFPRAAPPPSPLGDGLKGLPGPPDQQEKHDGAPQGVQQEPVPGGRRPLVHLVHEELGGGEAPQVQCDVQHDKH